MNARQSSVEHCQDIIRTHDKDRYLASLFAPDAVRPQLWALYAFNYEVARIREVTSEPQLGEIRLQWWHDAIAGITRGQGADGPLFSLLQEAIETGRLPRPALFNLLEARRFDLYNDPMPDLATLEGYLGETSSALIQLSAMLLIGARATDTAEAAGYAGIAYGIAGLLRAIPVHRARGQCYIPAELLHKHGANGGGGAGREFHARRAGSRSRARRPRAEATFRSAAEELGAAGRCTCRLPASLARRSLSRPAVTAGFRSAEHDRRHPAARPPMADVVAGNARTLLKETFPMTFAQRLHKLVPDLSATLMRFPAPALASLIGAFIVNAAIVNETLWTNQTSTRLIFAAAAAFAGSGAAHLFAEGRRWDRAPSLALAFGVGIVSRAGRLVRGPACPASALFRGRVWVSPS